MQTREHTKILNGFKFYNFLKRQNNPNIPYLEGDTSNNTNSLVFAIDPPANWNWHKAFTLIRDPVQFCTKYLSLPDQDKTFYEVISGHQKPHFDIDCKLSDFTSYESMVQLADDGLNLLLETIQAVMLQYNVNYDPEQHLLIYSSHGAQKRSFHVIITRFFHESHLEAKAFYDLVMKDIGDYIPKGVCIDSAVYKSSQEFRLVGSSKIGQGRYKTIIKNIPYLPEESPFDQFMHNLVGWYHGCEALPSFITKAEVTVGKRYNVEFDEEEALNIFNCSPYSRYYTKQNTEANGIIPLRRVRSGYCDLHRRTHDNIGAFLTVDRNGNVYFNCHADNPSKQSTIIGHLTIDNYVVDAPTDEGIFSFGDYVVDAPATKLNVIKSQCTDDDLTQFIQSRIVKVNGKLLTKEDVFNAFNDHLATINKTNIYNLTDRRFQRFVTSTLGVKTKQRRINSIRHSVWEGYAVMLPGNQQQQIEAIEEELSLAADWNSVRVPTLSGDHVKDHSPTLQSIHSLTGDVDRYCLLIKAPCGMGKTVSIVEELRRHPDAKVLVISGRRNFEEKQLEDLSPLGFELYDKINQPLYKNINRLIVQIDSLYKVRGSYDILILDELICTLDQLVVFTKEKVKCKNALLEYITETAKVIVADATLEDCDVEFIRMLRHDATIYENVHHKHNDKKVNIIKSLGEFYFYMLNDIAAGKKLLIPCGSKIEVNTISQIIGNSARVKTYTGDDEIDHNATNDWDQYDVVIYTGVITVGNSFILHYFDKVYGYFLSTTCTPESSMQMIFRARHLNDGCINIHVKNIFNTPYPRDIDHITSFKNYIIADSDNIRNPLFNIVSISNINSSIDITNPYFHIYCNSQFRSHRSKIDFTYTLIGLFKSQGIRCGEYITVNDDNKDDIEAIDDICEERKSIREDIIYSECSAVADSEDITYDQAIAIGIKERKSISERRALEKFKLVQAYGLGNLDVVVQTDPNLDPAQQLEVAKSQKASFVKRYSKDKFKFRQFNNLVPLMHCSFDKLVDTMIEVRDKFYTPELSQDEITLYETSTGQKYNKDIIYELKNNSNIKDYRSDMSVTAYLRFIGLTDFRKSGECDMLNNFLDPKLRTYLDEFMDKPLTPDLTDDKKIKAIRTRIKSILGIHIKVDNNKLTWYSKWNNIYTIKDSIVHHTIPAGGLNLHIA